jgi:dTDP-4-amino-4,6-dideoxygalactose transaminase
VTEPIHLFAPYFRTEEVLEEIRECLDRGWTGLGFKTVEIEREWCSYTGLQHAHFLNSASAGLHLAMRLLKDQDGWQDGDEVVTTPLTFVSTNHPILYECLQPVFADVDEYLCLDPLSVAERISPRTRAVVFVGLGGSTGRLREVADLCRQKGLRLILDAAHMAGTRLDDQHVGGQADITVFSFHAVKNVPTADSGMICCRDVDLDRVVRQWTWLGIDKDTYSRSHEDKAYRWLYGVPNVGFKYHGNSIMAAMAKVGLRYLDEDNGVRRRFAQLYEKAFAGRTGIEVIPMPAGCESSRHLFQVEVDRRDEVMVELNRRKIYPGVHYRSNQDYPMYRNLPGPCPRALAASQRVISLPMHLRMSEADVQRVATALVQIVEG